MSAREMTCLTESEWLRSFEPISGIDGDKEPIMRFLPRTEIRFRRSTFNDVGTRTLFSPTRHSRGFRLGRTSDDAVRGRERHGRDAESSAWFAQYRRRRKLFPRQLFMAFNLKISLAGTARARKLSECSFFYEISVSSLIIDDRFPLLLYLPASGKEFKGNMVARAEVMDEDWKILISRLHFHLVPELFHPVAPAGHLNRLLEAPISPTGAREIA